MAIEIYDKAAIVRKDGRYFYLLKCGSKNSFTCPNQYVADASFHDRYLRGMSRDSHWKVIAYGGEQEHKDNMIARTRWNCTTGGVYGAIRFGNKRNIALYYVRNRDKVLDYDALDDEQKRNVDKCIDWALKERSGWTIDLSNISDDLSAKEVDTYCGTSTPMDESNSRVFAGIRFWDLDNL